MKKKDIIQASTDILTKRIEAIEGPFFELVKNNIIRQAVDNNGLRPVIHALRIGGEITSVEITSNFDRDSKHDVFIAAGKQLALEVQDVVAVTISTEAWASIASAEDKAPKVMPSEDPNRKEIVSIHGADAFGRLIFFSGEIKRNKKDKITEIVDMKIDNSSKWLKGELASAPLLGLFLGSYIKNVDLLNKGVPYKLN